MHRRGVAWLVLIMCRCAAVVLQDPKFDKVIKALYGDVDKFDAEVRAAGSRGGGGCWVAKQDRRGGTCSKLLVVMLLIFL